MLLTFRSMIFMFKWGQLPPFDEFHNEKCDNYCSPRTYCLNMVVCGDAALRDLWKFEIILPCRRGSVLDASEKWDDHLTFFLPSDWKFGKYSSNFLRYLHSLHAAATLKWEMGKVCPYSYILRPMILPWRSQKDKIFSAAARNNCREAAENSTKFQLT